MLAECDVTARGRERACYWYAVNSARLADAHDRGKHLQMTSRSASGRRSSQQLKRIVGHLFERAGIRIDGTRSFDIRVHDDRFYKRIALRGALGLGEAYVDGLWDADRIDELTCRLAQTNLRRRSLTNMALDMLSHAQWSGAGAVSAAFDVGRRHYDLGNDLFEAMLDERMIYSCAYWPGATTLDRAQENKLALTCTKLGLKPGMRVLDIGCGWGGWAKFAAERYGVDVVGLTISHEQAAYARTHCAGLPVDIRLQDYRTVTERFDRIVSIGMFEHVGHRYYRTFMQVVNRCLKDDGVFLLHTIVGNEPVAAAQMPWLAKYIFPNGEIPSLTQLLQPAQKLFVVEAMHHFGVDYERTLEAWLENFKAHWPQLGGAYDERFYRTWTYYLAMARGFFQARALHVWQVVFTKGGQVPSGNALDSAVFDTR